MAWELCMLYQEIQKIYVRSITFFNKHIQLGLVLVLDTYYTFWGLFVSWYQKCYD